MIMSKFIFVLIGAWGVSGLALGQTYHLAEFQGVNDENIRYFTQLANAALSPNDQVTLTGPMSPERMMLETGKAQGLSQLMIWNCSLDSAKHAGLKRIDIPLDRGLSSYWVLAVNHSKRAELAKITSIQQLSNWRLSTGFPQNNAQPIFGELRLINTPTIKSALEMTAKGRLDGVLMQVRMANSLQSSLPAGVTLDQQLVIARPNAACFYVQKTDQKLARSLQTGLNRIIKDGLAQRLSEQAGLPQVIKALQLDKRRTLTAQPDANWRASEIRKAYPGWLFEID